MIDLSSPARPKCQACIGYPGCGRSYWNGQGYDDCESCKGTGKADAVQDAEYYCAELTRVRALAKKEIERLDEQVRTLTETLHSLPR